MTVNRNTRNGFACVAPLNKCRIMLQDIEIVKIFNQRLNDALAVNSWWRANEVRDNYNVLDGDQWLEEAIDRQNNDGMPLRTVNMVKPIINSISGFEIQNRSEVKYIPRLTKEDSVGFTDMVQSGVNYIEQESFSDFQASLAFADMLTCGVGVTDTTINYDNNPDGEVKVERVFPYFILWDVTARAKNIADANWVARARIVDKDTIEDYIGKNNVSPEEIDATFGASMDARFLDYFNVVMIAKSLAIVYEYQWREKKPFYRVENPLIGFIGDPEDPYTQNVVELAKILKEKYSMDPASTKVFSVDGQDFKALKEAFQALGFDVKYTKQERYKYYRAIIAGNKVTSKSENFSDNGFSIKFMTGYFSEMRQCYFGVVRAAKEMQRLLNQSVSDYEGFLRTVPKGGVEIEADAVPNMQAFVQTYTKAREVTIYNPGGLAKTRQKTTPPAPQGLFDMINYSSNAMLEVSGITKDFMGMIDSKLMTATLNRQLVRQGLTMLAGFFDAKKFYTIAQGKLFIDCLKILSENAEGRLMRVMDNGEAQYIPLLRNGIAAEYDIIVEDVPQTPSEREETFQKLMELAGVLLNKPNPVDITPMALQYSPLKGGQINKIMELMQPPPPPEPDPMVQKVLEAETAVKIASAEKYSADAKKSMVDAMLKEQALNQNPELINAEVNKVLADGMLARARAVKELQTPKYQPENR